MRDRITGPLIRSIACRRDNTSFFSLIAPAEWSAMGNDPPARFVGSYRLEADQSWTVVVTPS